MRDLIERKEAIEAINKYGKDAVSAGRKHLDPVDDIAELCNMLDALPAVDAAPVEYPVILVREGNGAYSALIPDFDCATCGESEAETRQKATECIAGRMLLMRDDNETFPEPSKMTNGLLHCCCVDADANPDNAFWVLCQVKMEGKTK